MDKTVAVNNRVLDVDLTSGNIGNIDITDDMRRDYLGGKGLAMKLLYDRIQPGIDPLSPDNILVMANGPTTGTSCPAGGRFVVAGKSPLTGIFASSYAGGRFGLSLKKAGYDAVVIRGRSSSPVYIHIDDGDVYIRDASSLWGMDTYDIQEERKDEGDWAVIGPAGENLVRYALVASGTRFAGRCGLGAVMGSKNLKGLVARGSRKIVAADPQGFKEALQVARKKVKSHHMTGMGLHEFGTAQNVMIYGSNGVTPVRNFNQTYFDQVYEISGERIREEYAVKNHGCVECPIQCGITGTYRGTQMITPQYETIGLMGSNLLIGDISQIAIWNEKLNRLGMDSISAGNVIGFVMELTEKGMLESALSFGNPHGIDDILQDIAYRRGLGDDLAEGVKRLSEKYGGQEFAIHVKGLEMPAYDPRGCTGQGLGYATACNGANHLSGSTHAIEVGSYLHPQGTKGKAHFVRFMQDLTEGVNSSIFCIQTEYPFLEENFIYKRTPMLIMRLVMRNLAAIATATTDLSDYCALLSGLLGYKIGRKKFYEIGERSFNLERYMNCREGISRADDSLPPRILEEVREDGWPPVELDEMLDKYYKIRGWDESGRPRPGTLDKLGISI